MPFNVPQAFQLGPDYTLSFPLPPIPPKDKSVQPGPFRDTAVEEETHTHLVSEPSPCLTNGLGAWLRIVHCSILTSFDRTRGN